MNDRLYRLCVRKERNDQVSVGVAVAERMSIYIYSGDEACKR